MVMSKKESLLFYIYYVIGKAHKMKTLATTYEQKWRNMYVSQLKLQLLCYTATATLNVVLYERTICRVQIQKEVIFVLKRGSQFL
jgi:hypothetical protein